MQTVKPGMYRHFKGTTYVVHCVAVHSETLEPLVIYSSHTGWWARPVDMFADTVMVDDMITDRFTYLER
jgi:cyclomaltodextrinase / maltogenic alpha-amylase / neopullulanase